jgi:hypothetical protein
VLATCGQQAGRRRDGQKKGRGWTKSVEGEKMMLKPIEELLFA